jgi:hypothetical protein
MAIEFRVKQYVLDYVKVGDEYQRIEAKSDYKVSNYDDLQNLLMTLIDFGSETLKFEVEKREVAE